MPPKKRKHSSFSNVVDVTLGGDVVSVKDHQLRRFKPDYVRLRDGWVTYDFYKHHFSEGAAQRWSTQMVEAVLSLIGTDVNDVRIIAAFAKVYSQEFGVPLARSLEELGPFFNSLPRTPGGLYTRESIIAYLKTPGESVHGASLHNISITVLPKDRERLEEQLATANRSPTTKPPLRLAPPLRHSPRSRR